MLAPELLNLEGMHELNFDSFYEHHWCTQIYSDHKINYLLFRIIKNRLKILSNNLSSEYRFHGKFFCDIYHYFAYSRHFISFKVMIYIFMFCMYIHNVYYRYYLPNIFAQIFMNIFKRINYSAYLSLPIIVHNNIVLIKTPNTSYEIIYSTPMRLSRFRRWIFIYFLPNVEDFFLIIDSFV